MRLAWFKKLHPILQTIILLGLIFVLTAVYLCLSQYIQPKVISLLTLPLKFCQDFSVNAQQFLRFQDLIAENKRLKNKVAELSTQLVEGEEISLENARLRSLLALPQKWSLQTCAASLIGKDSSNWTRTILINKGLISGVKKGMPVVFGYGLVGRVVESYAEVSKVVLITDFDSKAPALVQRTREEGVVFGYSYQGKNLCKMKYIHEIQIGDKVISSGLGGIYPKGLLIGEVVAVEEEENALYKIAEIHPTVNFSTLEEVMIITSQ